jgi:hypothetical protein
MPKQEQVEKAIKLMAKRAINYEYFFSKLNDDSWIIPLKERGLFNDPPAAYRDSEGRIIGAPIWPQSRYLYRMAEKTPEAVIRIAQSINTDNFFVLTDFTEAAQIMPAAFAAEWAIKMSKWLKSQTQMHGILEMELGKLISKLAKEGELAAALGLAIVLLEVLPDPKANEKMEETDRITDRKLEPTIRFDRYHYDEILKDNISDLIKAAPQDTFAMLCELLQKAIEYSVKKSVEEAKGVDISSIWRPAIEDHDQNHDFHISCPLIVAVRDAAEKVCKEKPGELPNIVQALEARKWSIFKRIALYLLTIIEEPPLEMIKERLANEDKFNSTFIHHEYFHLMRKHFGKLPTEERNAILVWIEEARKRRERLSENEPDLAEEHKAMRIKWWQYKKLIPVQEYLEGKWKLRFKALAKELGPAHHPDFHFWMSGWKTGPTSPAPAQKLSEMSVEELAAYLKGWKAPKEEILSDEVFEPSPEGLGRELAKIVAEDPDKYVALIEEFMVPEIDRIYVRHLIHGFSDALRNQRAIPYEQVLKLCKWVVDQPAAEGEEKLRHFDEDQSWHYPRQAIGDLIELFFLRDNNPPIELRSQIWQILEPLAADLEPNADYETQYGGKNMDYLTLSINTTRGKALHAMMHYSVWVKRNIKIMQEREATMADLPEIKAVWEAHLGNAEGPFYYSETDHAVFGDWLPLLNYFDPEWTKSMIPAVFPEDPALRNLRLAAWSTFLSYSRASLGPTYALLKDIYFAEVRALKGKGFERDDHTTPEFKLAGQVMSLYAIGKVTLAEGDLVDLFFDSANAGLTAHAIFTIGNGMTGRHENEQELVAQFKPLWEWRIEKCGGIDKVPKEELVNFAWWFRAGKFGDDWTFGYLEKILRITGLGQLSFHVIDQMKSTIQDYPMETLRCFKRIVEWQDEYWALVPREEGAAWQVLNQGLAHEKPEARVLADEIVNLLGSKGFLKYRDLLKKHHEK